MLILPAIDLFKGQAVRLYKGDYDKKTVYSDVPVDVALAFKEAGAACIHLVDLEGAREGTTPNFDLICWIKEESGLICQVGGGIRSEETIRRYVEAGMDRVILGTAAVENPGFVSDMVHIFGNRIAVSIDIRDGFVAVSGWTQNSQYEAMHFAKAMQDIGVKTLIVTDISKDGAMQGTNLALYRTLAERFSMDIIASGGVSSLDDVRALRSLNLYGAILGKAYYTGAVDLKAAIEEAK